MYCQRGPGICWNQAFARRRFPALTHPWREAIETQHLDEQVARRLTRLILDGELRPGHQLPTEKAIADMCGVGRSVVREALVRLKALGIIEVRQGKGAFVAEAPSALLAARMRSMDVNDRAQLQEIWEVREALETRVASLAAQRRTPDDLDRLSQAIEAMDRDVTQGGMGIHEDALFHHYLVQAARNSVLTRLLDDIATLIHRTRARSLAQPGRSLSSNVEHKAIYQAVAAGDGHRAAELMEHHVSHGRRLTTET